MINPTNTSLYLNNPNVRVAADQGQENISRSHTSLTDLYLNCVIRNKETIDLA